MAHNNAKLLILSAFVLSLSAFTAATEVQAQASRDTGKSLNGKPVKENIRTAECENLGTALRSAKKGDTIKLAGNKCQNLLISYSKTPVTIDARGIASVKGLRIFDSQNIRWIGGQIEASGGKDGLAVSGYGITIDKSSNISFDSVYVTNALRGVVTRYGAADITIKNSTFSGLRSDGINIPGTKNALIENNVFKNFSPKLSVCTLPNGTIKSPYSKRNCENDRGSWVDGDHPDCVQMWAEVANVVLRNNTIDTRGYNSCQGITNFGTGAATESTTNVLIERNTVITDAFAAINFGKCNNCTIKGNTVRVPSPDNTSVVRISLTGDNAVACGNIVQNNRPTHPATSFGTQPCK